MCSICDGKTWEQVMQETHDMIGRYGYTLQGVEPDLDHPPWVYTIGLLESFDHPELSILGVPLNFGMSVLGAVAQGVVDGDWYQAGETVAVGGSLHFHIAEVDPQLWEGDMFGSWHNYYTWRGDHPAEQWALELVTCPKLIDDSVFATTHLPNRTARRALTRRPAV
jgi:hypothetical protein